MSVTGVPWDPQASKRDDVLLPQIVGGDQQPLAPSVPVEQPKKSMRRLYITKRDLDKYGYTAGCVAGDATRIGKRGTGVHHTPACRERIERLLQAEEGNLRVAQHTAKVDTEITGQKQEVSEEGTKILYGYSSERPQGVPQGFKVFARLDKNARYLKGTMPEGPSWDNVWWRVTRDFKTGDVIKSEPIDPNLGDEVINAPLIDDTDIVTELWYSQPQGNLRQVCQQLDLLWPGRVLLPDKLQIQLQKVQAQAQPQPRGQEASKKKEHTKDWRHLQPEVRKDLQTQEAKRQSPRTAELLQLRRPRAPKGHLRMRDQKTWMI